jgi:hypothetical protein
MVCDKQTLEDRSNHGNTCGALAESLERRSEVLNKAEAMKIRRTMTRREFYVRTAGWFTVLKPDTRFPALNPRSGFLDLRSPSREPIAIDHADSRETANSPQIMIPTTIDRRLVRQALIVLTAMLVTFGLLWWICIPR